MRPYVDLRHLRILSAVADCASFSAAAAQLNVEPSAVSRAVHDAEDQLGVLLFERHARGVHLTAAGESYISAARDVLGRLSRAEMDARQAGAGSDGALSIGYVWSFGGGPIVGLLASFRATYPDVDISTAEDGNDKLIARLRTGELDIVITATDPPPYSRLKAIEGLASQPLWLEPLWVAVPEQLERESMSWDDLSRQVLLCRPADDWPRFVVHVRRAGGPDLSFQARDISRSGLVGLVAADLGWVILPKSSTNVRVAGVKYLRITSPGAALQVEVLWRARSGNPVVKRFLALAQHLYASELAGADATRSLDPSP